MFAAGGGIMGLDPGDLKKSTHSIAKKIIKQPPGRIKMTYTIYHGNF
ncbi:MAG: hypothetical protein K6T65_16105 [Peptococcaceae bacterium]|nr:hypothetical protein [Peptococcaceae bacterium]